MPQDDFYTPDDIDLLRMENELLAFEVRFLKARLNEPSGGVPRASGPAMSLSRLQHLEDAEKDLKLLVRRLRESPFGAVLRRSKNFRGLERRYLDAPPDHDSQLPSRRPVYLEGAERDLQKLLRFLGKGPMGALLRRRSNFRTLEDRYL